MTLSTAHCRLRAEEARIAARLSSDRELRRLLLEIARAYQDLADAGDWPETAIARRHAGHGA